MSWVCDGIWYIYIHTYIYKYIYNYIYDNNHIIYIDTHCFAPSLDWRSPAKIAGRRWPPEGFFAEGPQVDFHWWDCVKHTHQCLFSLETLFNTFPKNKTWIYSSNIVVYKHCCINIDCVYLKGDVVYFSPGLYHKGGSFCWHGLPGEGEVHIKLWSFAGATGNVLKPSWRNWTLGLRHTYAYI